MSRDRLTEAGRDGTAVNRTSSPPGAASQRDERNFAVARLTEAGQDGTDRHSPPCQETCQPLFERKLIMNASKILIASAFAAFAAVGAQAGEVDLTPLPEFHSTRTVAEVRAEAVAAQRAGQIAHGEQTLVAQPALSSTLTRAEVRNDAKVAQRAGQIPHGDLQAM